MLNFITKAICVIASVYLTLTLNSDQKLQVKVLKFEACLALMSLFIIFHTFIPQGEEFLKITKMAPDVAFQTILMICNVWFRSALFIFGICQIMVLFFVITELTRKRNKNSTPIQQEKEEKDLLCKKEKEENVSGSL